MMNRHLTSPYVTTRPPSSRLMGDLLDKDMQEYSPPQHVVQRGRRTLFDSTSVRQEQGSQHKTTLYRKINHDHIKSKKERISSSVEKKNRMRKSSILKEDHGHGYISKVFGNDLYQYYHTQVFSLAGDEEMKLLPQVHTDSIADDAMEKLKMGGK